MDGSSGGPSGRCRSVGVGGGAVHLVLGVGNLPPVHGEDHDGFDGRPDDDGSAGDGPTRGWVPPDDRLWLHPSERAGATSGSALQTYRGAPKPIQHGNWMFGGLTVCVIVTLVLSGMVIAAANDGGHTTATGVVVTGVPTTEVDLSHLTDSHSMQTLASTARDSTVALVITRRTGTTVGTGIVAEAGGIIVALQSAVVDAHAITVVEPDGTRQTAVRVGADPATGIVVLRIADDLPVAAFTTGDPVTGSVAVVMSEEEGVPGGRPATHLYAGTVLYAGITADTWPRSRFCATAIAAPLSANNLGSPLVEPSGSVAGIFAGVIGSGRSRVSIFLPAELVRDVTAQIVSHGSVSHGTLGADTVEPSPVVSASVSNPGAVVRSVSAGGSADLAGLAPGDRIVSVDGAEVRSVSELDTRLYADPPGTELPITFVRNGGMRSATVVLGVD